MESTIAAIDLAREIRACHECLLRDGCHSPVPWSGPQGARVMVIGEAPGQWEDKLGRPFSGDAGKDLDALLSYAGLDRADVAVSNVVHCRPRNNRTPTKAEVEFCASRWTEAELEYIRPEVVVTVGVPAMQYFLPEVKALDQVARIPSVVERPWGSFTLFPTYHPAVMLYDPESMSHQVGWGFKRLREILANGVPKLLARPSYKEVDGIESLLPEHLPDTIAIDTESTPDGSPYCVTLSWAPGKAVLIPTTLILMGDLQAAIRGKRVVFHNALHDLLLLEALGVTVDRFEDTMVQAFVLGEPTLGLKALAGSYRALPMRDFMEVFPKGDIRSIDKAAMLDYACRDADATLQLYQLFSPELERLGLWEVYETDRDCLPAALEMMRNGMLIDKEHFAHLEVTMTARVENAKRVCVKLAGHEYNPNSPPQTAEVLYEELNLPRPRKRGKAKKDGKPGTLTTEKPYLDTLDPDLYPIAPAQIEFKRLIKLLGTYIRPIPLAAGPDGRVHTQIKPTSAGTGRWATGDPINLQNQPTRDEEGREVKDGFIAPPGWKLIEVDKSQIELRTGAHISRDPGLLRAFLEGQDIHKAIAAQMYMIPMEEVTPDQRRNAKIMDFGVFYGMSAGGAARNANSTEEWAESFLHDYMARYPGIATYSKRAIQFATRMGYIVSPSGRRRYMFAVYAQRESARSHAQRAIINMPVQEFAAYNIKKDMRCEADNPMKAFVVGELERRGLTARLLMQVHDSLLLEAPEDQALEVGRVVQKIMENSHQLLVPVKAEIKIGDRWGSLKEVE